MYECEICGKKTDSLYIISVEKAELSVCKKCSAGKDVIDVLSAEENEPQRSIRQRVEEPEEELIDGYGNEIRKARERLGIPLKVLAELINEKESTLLRVEQERMQPSMKLMRKLEKELGIKLTAKPELGAGVHGSTGASITLGDAAFRKEK